MLIPLLLATSLWQASTAVGPSLSCYEEANHTVICYDSAGNNPFTIYFTPKANYSSALATDLVLIALGASTDLGSTDWATQRGCREANPLFPRPEGTVAGKIALSALRGGVAYLLRSHGKDKLAGVWRYAGLATDLAITGNNIYCGSK